jgi:hypothetical protein
VVNGTNAQEGHTVIVEECFCHIDIPPTFNFYFAQVGLIVLNENRADLSVYNSRECHVNNILSARCVFAANNSLSTNNRVLVNGGYINQIFQQNRSVVLCEGVTTGEVHADVTDDGAISFHGTTTKMILNFGVLTGTNQLDISRSKIGELEVVAANSSKQTVDARGSEISSGLFNAMVATAEAVLDTRGGSLEKTAFTFSGANAAWDRLSDAVFLENVPDGIVTETYQNVYGNLPKAGWPTGTTVVYQFQITKPATAAPTTRVDVINAGTNAEQVQYDHVSSGPRDLYLTMQRMS